MVTAELEQLHMRDAFRPVRIEKLSQKKKHESLSLLMFLKKTRRINKGPRGSGLNKTTVENLTEGCHISDSLDGRSNAHSNNRRIRRKRSGGSRHTRGIFERGYGRQDSRGVHRHVSRADDGGQFSAIPTIRVI